MSVLIWMLASCHSDKTHEIFFFAKLYFEKEISIQQILGDLFLISAFESETCQGYELDREASQHDFIQCI